MITAFISDLHLDPQKPHLKRLFDWFLTHYQAQIERLYILGDLFEVWVGDDNHSSFNTEIIRALKHFTSLNKKLYFLPGNRDFLIGRRFCKETGCILLKEPALIDLYGERVLLTHGDRQCMDDTEHQAFRRHTDKWWVRYLFLRKPLQKRIEFAKMARQKSQQHILVSPDYLMDVNTEAWHQLMKHQCASTLIHGHTHRPSIEYFNLHDKPACRIVLGDWDQQGNALFCTPSGEKRLIWFNAHD